MQIVYLKNAFSASVISEGKKALQTRKRRPSLYKDTATGDADEVSKKLLELTA